MVQSHDMFKIIRKSKISRARVGISKTAHGEIKSPFFMPIATRGAVKNLTSDELKKLNAEIILSNTYHLLLRPGINLIKKAKNLHNFINWPGPILTDSGGFQIFSLAKHRKITKKGVKFRDPQNGKKYFLSPELAIKIQQILGSDIAMVLDECAPYPATKSYIEKSVALTTKWAARCKSAYSKWQIANRKSNKRYAISNKPLLFGIIQGGIYKDLRIKSAKEIVKLAFNGYAIGGVAVGEPREKMKQVLNWVLPELPENKPRYLMGVGKPEEIVEAVKQGIDMFDCVIPTREARHGRLYLFTFTNSKRIKTNNTRILAGCGFYKTINIQNAKYKNDLSPINSTNLKQYSKAYLHHLFRTNEPLGMRLATLNNLNFYLGLMATIRQLIRVGKL